MRTKSRSAQASPRRFRMISIFRRHIYTQRSKANAWLYIRYWYWFLLVLLWIFIRWILLDMPIVLSIRDMRILIILHFRITLSLSARRRACRSLHSEQPPQNRPHTIAEMDKYFRFIVLLMLSLWDWHASYAAKNAAASAVTRHTTWVSYSHTIIAILLPLHALL